MRGVEPRYAPTTTQKQKAPFGAFCFWSRMNRGIEAASGTDAGGESDKHECLRTHACLGASERMQARARPARPIPAGSTNHRSPDSYQSGFFCPLPQCWRGSAHFPLERLDGNGATIHARTPRFLSLFYAGHLSVQVAWSSKINDLQWAGCNWQALRGWELAMRILTDGHKKAASRAAVCFGDVLVPIGTAPALPAELPTRWAGLRRE